ncbi:target of Myb protein 1 [Actinidia rufa]|uniref:Target of Myb protein 1 n=1 Tax=Actinidia rufa TaxID=165716 RepID=A0A7J0GGC8_9ERIC|nr:target of Myb protein 1 [Actinidia rufa]
MFRVDNTCFDLRLFWSLIPVSILILLRNFNIKKAFGVEFPPRGENSVPLLTPPQTQPISHPALAYPVDAFPPSAYEEAAVQASLQSEASGLSLAEIQTAQGLADVLTEILGALDPKSPEETNTTGYGKHIFIPFIIRVVCDVLHGLKQEVIIDLAEQCRSYQKRVMILVNNTVDEDLLCKGLALNDNLQRVLRQHDDIAKGTPIVGSGTTPNSVAPLVNVNHEDDESEDDFAQLAHRSSRDTSQVLGRKPANAKNEVVRVSPLLPPPPSSKKSAADEGMMFDYLSGEAYNAERSSGTSGSTSLAVPIHSNSTSSNIAPSNPTPHSSSPPSDYINPTASMFTGPTHDEPARMTKSADALPPAPWDAQPPTSLPPPPSKYNQRQQFFEQQQSGGGAHSSSGSGSSYDSLVGHTQNLSLDRSPPTKQEKPEDALFKDLVDFAKAKSSSPSKPNNRSF